MPNPSAETLFNFPCDYPIKVFGKHCEQLQNVVCEIIKKHTNSIQLNQISSKQSAKGNYVSLTIRIVATSKAQLDAINQDLQNCNLVIYVL